MTSLTLDLPSELFERLQQTATELGQPVDVLVAAVLAERFLPPAAESPAPHAADRLTLRQVRLTGWPADSTYRREETYGDDGRCLRRRHEYLALRD